MEKLIYVFWEPREVTAFADSLAAGLRECAGVHGVQLNVPDHRFSGGSQPVLHNILPRLDGAAAVWLDSRLQRGPVEETLAPFVSGFHGYAVMESEPLAPATAAPGDGRLAALSQLCLLRRPQRLSYDVWLDIWLGSHTPIAIATQRTTHYVQNIVHRPLTADAPAVDAIVEECFPEAAYADPGVYFDAPDDPAARDANIRRLLESTARFLDSDCVDRIFTSRYSYCGAVATAAAGPRHGR
jgi:hypothetical protein